MVITAVYVYGIMFGSVEFLWYIGVMFFAMDMVIASCISS